MDHIEDLYRARFCDAEIKEKSRAWRMIVRTYLQQFVKPTDTVLDIGAGYGEFINNIRASKKIAVDVNKDIQQFIDKDVRLIIANCCDLKEIKDNSVDVVFMSNLLEHMRNTDAIEQVLREGKRVLKKGGRLLLLQPNIKYAYREYWDFFDHVVPLSDRSVTEALRKLGYTVVLVKPRFLPFSSKTVFPKLDVIIWLYLKIGILQRIFGKQMFIVAHT